MPNQADWPKAPEQIETVNELFEKADQQVSEKWQEKAGANNESAMDLQQQISQDWLKQLPKKFQAKNPEVALLLSEPAKLSELLRQQRLGNLEPLKEVLPEAWETLTLLSSERQLAKIALTRKWLKEMPDNAFKKLEFSRTELLLQNDLAALVGKLIDHGYLKQEELAKVLGQEEVEEAGPGKKYLYSLPQEGEKKLTPFQQVLPFELQRFKADLEALTNKTEKLLAEKKLPDSYQGLPAYLKNLAETYCSNETNPEKVIAEWKELYKTNAQLLKDGCPLVINPQEDAPFDVVGLEMRIGLRSPHLQKLEDQIGNYSASAYNLNQQIYQEQSESTAQAPAKINVFLSDQRFAFGPNLQSKTSAESYHYQMFIHTNEVKEVATKSEIPLLKKVMPDLNIDEKEYLSQAILETARHENAHTIVPSEDEAVMKRIGESAEANILEELKAETVGLKLINKDLSKVEANNILLAKLGTLLDYLKNKSGEKGSEGEDYHLCGVKIMTELLNQGVIKIENQKLKITDAKSGIEKIAALGDEILEIYKNPQTTPKEVKFYVAKVRALRQDNQIKQLLEILK